MFCKTGPRTNQPVWLTCGRLVLAALCVVTQLGAQAQPSQTQLSAFQKYNSCPSTGRRSGACPGYRVAHKVPLCAGGQDTWTNMLWLTEVAAREKLRSDAAACAGQAK